MHKLIIPAITLIFGLVLGFILSPNPNNKNTSEADLDTLDENTEVLMNDISNINIEDSDQNELELFKSKIKQVLNKKDQQIAQLKNQIQQLRSNDTSKKKGNLAESESSAPMSVEELEKLNKEMVLTKVKTSGLQLDEEQSSHLQKTFENNNEVDDWSIEYEKKISDYLQNTNNQHQIDSIICKADMCRIEVYSPETQAVEKLIASISQQSWAETVHMKTNSSDDPEQHVFYLPRLK